MFAMNLLLLSRYTGNDDLTLKKDFHEVNFQIYSNPLFEFDDNFKSSNVNPLFEENDKDSEIKSSSSFTLTSPKENSDSPFNAELSVCSLIFSRNEDKENFKENISSGTLLIFNEPSFLLPPPELPDEYLTSEPILVMKNVVLNEDFYQSKKTLPLNVEDVDSFTFIIWIFLPYFTYTEESPLIFSFRSENFVFDPGIITFHNPVAFSSEVHAFRLVFSGWGVKSLSTYPMTVGLLEKKVIHGTSEPTMYGYIKNYKKTVKNGQARTRESEEYKKKPKNQSRSQKVKPARSNSSQHGQQKTTT
ncbi:hypothetical protein Tco_0806829 [Tanacetum coccineum]